MNYNDDLPSFLTRLDPRAEPDITFDYRDKLVEFNTQAYWWCYFDKSDFKLYDQFCCLIMDDARDYLISSGLINKDLEVLKYSDH